MGWRPLQDFTFDKVANDHCGFIPLSNNDKRYDSSKDLSYFNFRRDKQKRKRTLC